MIQNKNLSERANIKALSSQYSNLSGEELLDKTKSVLGKVKDFAKDTVSTPPSPESVPPVPSPEKEETTIFGMHPLTLIIGTGITLIISVVAYKALKK